MVEVSVRLPCRGHRRQLTNRSQILREPAAEFAGTMLLVIFGTGVNCQAACPPIQGWRPSPKGVSNYLHLLNRNCSVTQRIIIVGLGFSMLGLGSWSVLIWHINIVLLIHERFLLAIALGAWVSGGVSGGHINPAVLRFSSRSVVWR